MSKLQEIIQRLIELANASPNKWQSKRLAKGLTIHIMNDVTAYKLVIARADTHPSRQEWRTVTKYWTYPIGEPEYKTDFHNGRFFLKGRIPRQGAFV